MKEGSHKFPVGGPSLPRPELNPLTNPVLGRNLGRWAQVYFTSPPEKREQAGDSVYLPAIGQRGAKAGASCRLQASGREDEHARASQNMEQADKPT